MKKRSSYLHHSRIEGTFTVELGVMALAFSLIFAFCGDVVVRLSTKGKLDRMAYSAVTIIKERTALFDTNDFSNNDDAQFNSLVTIVSNSLKRTLGSFDETEFGMTLEVALSDGKTVISKTTKKTDEDITCEPAEALTSAIAVTKSDKTKTTLYRVTLCYQTENWFGALVDKDYGLVSTNAVSIGR